MIMGYAKKIFDEADMIMQSRRSKAITELEADRREIYSALPRIEELEHEVASYALKAVKMTVNGNFDRGVLEDCRKNSLEAQEKIRLLLIENGYSSDALDEKYTCPKCEDTGYIDGIMCDCKRALLREIACRHFSSDCIKSDCRFENFSLEYYPDDILEGTRVSQRKIMERLYSYCKDYVNTFGRDSKSLLMIGSTGLGKTHLSVAMSYELTKNGFGVIYCSAPDMMRRLENEYFRKNDADTEQTEQTLSECDLLVIDDLGTEFSNKYSMASMYNIVNTRINMNKPTIISTNLTARELQNTYGMRFVSRLIGEFDKLTFVGSDIRQLKKRNNR